MTSRLINARAEMRAEVTLSQRGAAVGLPPGFIKHTGGDPALAKLVLGGQGGDVRTKLFLTFVMRATQAPHNLDGRTNLALGELLGLPPETAPRRVAAAMRWLKEAGFIELKPRKGEPAFVKLLMPGTAGAPWRPKDSNGAYVKVPLNLWNKGWIQVLTARAIGVYIALADLVSQEVSGESAMSGHRKSLYGYSDDTWTRALRELRRAGLISVRTEVNGNKHRMKRRRNVYRLTSNDMIGEAPTDTAVIRDLSRPAKS